MLTISTEAFGFANCTKTVREIDERGAIATSIAVSSGRTDGRRRSPRAAAFWIVRRKVFTPRSAFSAYTTNARWIRASGF